MDAIINNYNEKRYAALTAGLTSILIFILLIIITIDRSNPPIEQIEIIAEVPLEIIDETPRTRGDNGGGGGGNPTNDEVNPTPQPQTSSFVTTSDSDVKIESKGQSNKTTAKNSDNKATSTKKSNNPFGNGGQESGDGGGIGSGNGLGIGKDNGKESGEGSEGTKDRILLIKPNVENIVSQSNCKIYLKVKIDAAGNVTQADNIPAYTTTTNQALINKVIAATISKARYNKKPGANSEKGNITLELHAN